MLILSKSNRLTSQLATNINQSVRANFDILAKLSLTANELVVISNQLLILSRTQKD